MQPGSQMGGRPATWSHNSQRRRRRLSYIRCRCRCSTLPDPCHRIGGRPAGLGLARALPDARFRESRHETVGAMQKPGVSRAGGARRSAADSPPGRARVPMFRGGDSPARIPARPEPSPGPGNCAMSDEQDGPIGRCHDGAASGEARGQVRGAGRAGGRAIGPVPPLLLPQIPAPSRGFHLRGARRKSTANCKPVSRPIAGTRSSSRSRRRLPQRPWLKTSR